MSEKITLNVAYYFNTCFHDYFGYTPGEVKKKNLTDREPLSDNNPFDELSSAKEPTARGLTIVHNYPMAGLFPDEINAACKTRGIEGLFRWLIDVNINKPIPASGMNGQPFYIAWWYAIAGDKEKSLYWLEKNMETKGRLYTYFNLIALNPDFDLLRNDSRFLSMIDEIGLTPYHKREPKLTR